MRFFLYQTKDGENVINKEKTLIHDTRINFKGTENIITPSVVLRMVEGVNFFEANYCEISELNRFYFIQDMTLVNYYDIKLTLECDVLESFKDDILNSYAMIERPMKKGDYQDIAIETKAHKDYEIHKSDKDMKGEKTVFMSTIGGE